MNANRISQQKPQSIARAALEKLGSDVLILDVRELTSIADYFIIASGESERQVKAIANHIDKEVFREYQEKPLIEGAGTSMWILLDYGDVIVHVFKTDIRHYYALEKMWSDAPRLPLPEYEHQGVSMPSYQSGDNTKPLIAQYGS